ncbi:hypothetical protein ACKKBG_A35010 [Auxenochlorella protothecoides x Auxenochlorella symbiontica]
MAAPCFSGRCLPQPTLAAAPGRGFPAFKLPRSARSSSRSAAARTVSRRAFLGNGGFLEPEDLFWKDTLESQLQELDGGMYSCSPSSSSCGDESPHWDGDALTEDEPVTLRRLRAAISNLTWSLEGVHPTAAPAPPAPAPSTEVHVILFGVGQSELEGIYSLRASARDGGLPVDTIVAFAARDDAARYATLLEATMEHEPTVYPLAWGDLQDFCSSSGYRCRLEAPDSLLIPPEVNVGVTDWEKSLRLRQGQYAVLPDEPRVGEPRQRGVADEDLAGPGACLEGFFVPPPESPAAGYYVPTEGEPGAADWGEGQDAQGPSELQLFLRPYCLADPRILEASRAALEAAFAREP